MMIASPPMMMAPPIAALPPLLLVASAISSSRPRYAVHPAHPFAAVEAGPFALDANTLRVEETDVRHLAAKLHDTICGKSGCSKRCAAFFSLSYPRSEFSAPC
jgi:hypothetical protein